MGKALQIMANKKTLQRYHRQKKMTGFESICNAITGILEIESNK